MNIDQPSVIIDDEPILGEREDRPRSRTWPILPPPIETIHENERDVEIAEPPPIIEEVEPEEETNNTQKAETNPRKNSRKNAWGNLSYADLITQAIQSSPEQRLTLSQIYEWMVRNIPYFKDKGDSTSSAGWKNSIRHNLSLHSRFMRVQNDNNGKSSYWVINPDAKPGKSSRRRSGSVDGQTKGDKKQRVRNKKQYQSTDDISALSPNTLKLKHNPSYENLFVGSPCSSTDSLSNMEDFHGPDLPYPYNSESFARPRSTSNVSTQSSINGRATPTHPGEIDDIMYDENPIIVAGVENDIESMTIDNQVNLNNTINLSDTMLFAGGNNDNMLPIRRPHSSSFDSGGSGDSGYESPAYQMSSPNQQVNNIQNRGMTKLPSPNLVPNKPPPPYNNAFHQQMRQQQPPIFPASYYPQQPMRMNNMMPNAPRLTHLPMGSQNAFNVQQAPMKNFNPHMGNRNYHGAVHSNMFDGYMASSKVVAPNITVENKIKPFQQQQQNTQKLGMFPDDIPSDLHQLKLFGFDDQQQLASDLDAIIKNDMKESSNLQAICKPYENDTNNNTNNGAFNQQRVPNFPGHNWVR